MQVILKFAFASKHYQIIVDRALHLYPLYLHIILCCKKFFRNRSLSMPLEYYFIPMLITLIQKVKSKLKKKILITNQVSWQPTHKAGPNSVLQQKTVQARKH